MVRFHVVLEIFGLKVAVPVNFALGCSFVGHVANKQRVLTPGHQGWNDLHSLCRIGMEYYLLNNDDNNNNDDDDDDDDDDNNNKDNDDDNRNNNDNDYNHNNDTNNDNNENDNNKNSSDSKPVTV